MVRMIIMKTQNMEYLWNALFNRIFHQIVVHMAKVVELFFYHHDPESMACMLQYVTQMSQVLKDHIWTKLSLSHTMKQIYDKDKAIWWARVNARETMTWDNFIRQQDIAYLDQKHKIGSWCLHKNPANSI